MISEFRNLITISRSAAPTKSASGGLNKGSATTWTRYAKIESRSGSVGIDRSERTWNYTYKITIGYDPLNKERSGDIVTYDTYKLQIREVSFQDEGKRRLVILRCSTVE